EGLANLARALSELYCALEAHDSCGPPAKAHSEATKQALFDAYDQASDALETAEDRLVAAGAFTTDQPLEAALDRITSGLGRLRRALPSANEFLHGVDEFDRHDALEASMDVETAIKAAFFRMEQLA